MASNKHVHIIDDDEAIRRSTGYALKTTGHTVTAWSSGEDFLREVRKLEPGCILLDIRMPEIDGMEVQQRLTERGVTMPIVMMTGHGDIAIAVRALKAGAVDFLEKPFDKTALLTAMDGAFAQLARGQDAAARAGEAKVVLGVLTPRELEILDGLAKGLPNKTIAYDLGISARTVEAHRANVMLKLEVRSLSDALRIAFAAGMGAT